MPTGHKKEDHIVKIQVEAKQPRLPKQPKRHKKKSHKVVAKPAIPKALMDNFVGLQKVQANLAEKLDLLTKQIAELLNLFESTAKSFAENPAILTSERDKEFIGKINQLLEQDRIIAKGIVYIEDKVNEIDKEVDAMSGAAQPAAPMGAPMAPPTGEMIGEYHASSSQSPSPKPLPRV